MKKIFGFVLIVILVVLIFTLVPRHYKTKESCLKSELRNSQIILQLEGTDSQLVCYETRIGGEITKSQGILKNSGDQWRFYKGGSSFQFDVFFAGGILNGYRVKLKSSSDQYIFITDGIPRDDPNWVDIKNWNIKDSLNSKFYLIDTYDSGSKNTYYVACIPANIKGYTLQFGEWIIRDLDLNQPWNKTKAKVELIEEVGGLS